jgi:hypothetical protein
MRGTLEGLFILTGSQHFVPMEAVADSIGDAGWSEAEIPIHRK